MAAPFFIEFEIGERFEGLCRVFEALKHDKERESFRGDDEWLALFDDAALARFAPRATSPDAWDLGSVIHAFENGEYRLIGCRRISDSIARLEYEPLAGPFGGTDAMRELIAAFGGRITHDYWQD